MTGCFETTYINIDLLFTWWCTDLQN